MYLYVGDNIDSHQFHGKFSCEFVHMVHSLLIKRKGDIFGSQLKFVTVHESKSVNVKTSNNTNGSKNRINLLTTLIISYVYIVFPFKLREV